MAVRDSKRALAEVATLLGTDAASARTWLRSVQHLAGPVPYDQIAAALRAADTQDARAVADVITARGASTPGADRTVGS